MKSKVLARSSGAFGGSMFRAIDRGDHIVIQESARGARWKDLAVTSPAQFYDLADQFDLFNPYNSNPADLFKIAGAIRCRSNCLMQSGAMQGLKLDRNV